MCFVRKGLDWVFSYQELKWLDDILPGTRKPQKGSETKSIADNGKKEPTVADEENNSLIAGSSSNGNIQDSHSTVKDTSCV